MIAIAAQSQPAAADDVPRKPVLQEDWWQICTMPDLGELKGPVPRKQHIVDHGFVKAKNGKWQLWACLRGTAVSRFIYGWEGESLDKGPWKPVGVKVRASAKFGEQIRDGKETAGAPFFLQRDNKYLCLFHSGGFRLMESDDGVNYQRAELEPGSSRTGIPGGRDVMVMKHDDTWYAYSTVTTQVRTSHVLCSTSKDFRTWSRGKKVSEGGKAGGGPVDAESPFVLFLDGYFYLLRASSISFKTFVYRSKDPLDFSLNDDSKLIAEFKVKAPEVLHVDGKWYLSDLHDFQGIRMTHLKWERDE